MTYRDLDHSIKEALNDTAQEIQENPYAKQKFFDAIKTKEYHQMSKKKFFGKKAVIALAAVICLTCGTAIGAGGHLASWSSHYDGRIDPTYNNVEEVMEAQDEFEFIPVVVDEFSTGYKFKGAHMVESKARDDDEHVLAIVKGLDVEYTNADGEFFSFKMEKTPAVLREQIMAEQITPDKVQTYKGVDINYNFIAQKCVGGHYEPTAEEQQLMEAGKLNIMYDSETEHEPELFNLIQVKWFVDDVEYLIMAFDKWAPDLTEADLFAMAKEVIDQQQSAAQ